MEEVEEEEEEVEDGVVGVVRGFNASERSKCETHLCVLSWREVEEVFREVCCVRDQVRGG